MWPQLTQFLSNLLTYHSYPATNLPRGNRLPKSQPWSSLTCPLSSCRRSCGMLSLQWAFTAHFDWDWLAVGSWSTTLEYLKTDLRPRVDRLWSSASHLCHSPHSRKTIPKHRSYRYPHRIKVFGVEKSGRCSKEQCVHSRNSEYYRCTHGRGGRWVLGTGLEEAHPRTVLCSHKNHGLLFGDRSPERRFDR